MPGGVHTELTGVDTVGDGGNQQAGQTNADTQGIESSLRISFVAVLEQKYQTAEQAGNNTYQQDNDHDLDTHA